MGSHADPGLTEDVTRRLSAALVAVFRKVPPNLGPGLRLGDIDGWDSMNSMSFLLQLERTFDVTIGEVTFVADQTIADVLTVLRESGAATGN